MALECFKSSTLLLKNGGSLQVLVRQKAKQTLCLQSRKHLYHFTEPGGSNCDEKNRLALLTRNTLID